MVEIVTLTPNPALDFSTSVWRVEPTEKLRCTEGRRDPGGGGINVARAALRLGADVLAVYPAGGASGASLTRLLLTEGVAGHIIPAERDTRENFYVLEQETGRQFKFVLPGAPLSAAEQEALLEALRADERSADYVVLSGSLPPGASADFFARAAETAKAAGARVVLDTSGAALAAGLRQRVHLVKPNLSELSEMVGHALETEAAQLQTCQRLIESRAAEMVALTLGPHGALLVDVNGAWRSHAPRIQAVSTVGAGDSFLAGLVHQLADGASPEAALRYATAAGSAALLAPGAELCRREDVERLTPQVHVSQAHLSAETPAD